MLWTTLVTLTVLLLAGFVAADDDVQPLPQNPGRRKLASIDSDEYGQDEPSDEYVDDYPESSEEDDPLRRAESINLDEMDNKLRKTAHFVENPNPFLGNYLAHTKILLYNRHKKIQVTEASRWFQNFDHSKDLVILVHGVPNNENYIADFFNTISAALLHNGDYNVIGIDWRHFILNEKEIFDTERNAEEAMKIGHVLSTVVERAINPNYKLQIIPRITYIGHDMGTIPVVVQTLTYGYLIDSVYGLNPRLNLGSHDYLRLTQFHGRVVHTLSTLPFPYSLSHIHYWPIYNRKFEYKGKYFNLAYQLLADAILYGNMTARFCSSADDFIHGYCSRLAEVPLWYRQRSLECTTPVGKYFFEVPLPTLKPYCDGQAFITGGYN